MNISSHLFSPFVPLHLFTSFFPLFTIHSLSHSLMSIFLFPSPLSGGTGRECDSNGGRYGPDLLPPAELRWINCGHPESPPADPLLQRHTRCVSTCTFFPTRRNQSICVYAFALSDISNQPFKYISNDSLTLMLYIFLIANVLHLPLR